MKRRNTLLIIISTLLIISCSDKHQDQTKASLNTNTVSQKTSETVSTEEETDCVFDTSTYKSTTDAIKKYNSKCQYLWDDQNKEAHVFLDNKDTLTLHIGGCDHFSYSAKLKTNTPFTDNEKLITKAHWLAKTFFDGGFDTKYDECISRGLYKQTDTYDSTNVKAFEIIDKDTSMTNNIYEGFSFYKHGGRTEIIISGYSN